MIESRSNGHVLTFDEIKHYYALDLTRVDSVTNIIKQGSPSSPLLVNWMIKEGSKYVIEQLKLCPEQVNKLPQYLTDEIIKKSTQACKTTAQKAADIGSIVHDYAESFESGDIKAQDKVNELISDHVDREKIENCIKKFQAWKWENKDDILKHEEIVASPTYSYAGKLDSLRKRRSMVVLSDFKTSGSIYLEYWVQLGAYAHAVEEWMGIKVNALEVVRFGKEDGEFEVKTVSNPGEIEEYKQQFLRNLNTFKFYKKWSTDAKRS